MKYFHGHFFHKNGNKFEQKTIFSNISKQVGENLIILSGGGYLVTSRKIFQLGT